MLAGPWAILFVITFRDFLKRFGNGSKKKNQLIVTEYRLGTSYTCAALSYKPAFIARW